MMHVGNNKLLREILRALPQLCYHRFHKKRQFDQHHHIVIGSQRVSLSYVSIPFLSNKKNDGNGENGGTTHIKTTGGCTHARFPKNDFL